MAADINGPLLTFEYERDGFTVSGRRHVCGQWPAVLTTVEEVAA